MKWGVHGWRDFTLYLIVGLPMWMVFAWVTTREIPVAEGILVGLMGGLAIAGVYYLMSKRFRSPPPD